MKEWWAQVGGLSGSEVCTKDGKPKRLRREDLKEGQLTMLMVQGLKKGGLPPGLKKNKSDPGYDSFRSDVSSVIASARLEMSKRTPKKKHPVPALKM